MTNVESVISKLTVPKGNNCYFVLCLAVQEAARLYPRFPNEISLEELCCRIMPPAGKSTPGAVRRALERAVEYIWLHGTENPLLLAIYEHPIVEKLSAKDFIASAARYIQNRTLGSSGLWLTPTATPSLYMAQDGTPYFAFPCSGRIAPDSFPAFLRGAQP